MKVGHYLQARRTLSILLAWVLMLSNVSMVWAVSGTSSAPATDDGTVYTSVYATDFGDSAPLSPANWGFTTSNATVSVNTYDVGGNSTPKLSFAQADQKGGRVATKTFGSPVIGAQILVSLDWYPGKVNDKGSNPSENGGELRLLDISGNTVFTINNTNNAALTYYAGKQTAASTGFTNPQAWYKVQLELDVKNDKYNLKLTEQSTGTTETHSGSLNGVTFDGSVSSMRLVGVRTSGNNITWTTYLDNINVYNVPIPTNRITKVDKLSYKRVYVNQAGSSIDTLGLPQTVKVTLANAQKAEVAVAQWTAVGKAWDPATAGVYTFKGTLADNASVENGFGRYATCYVYNRLTPSSTTRQTEWLDRAVVALKADTGIFVSWRILADEYAGDVKFNVYRNGEKLNASPITTGNYLDASGQAGDTYTVETLAEGVAVEKDQVTASAKDYLSIPLQKPEGGTTATGNYTYSANDAGVGDLDGDGEYEIIVKWYPSNAIDSSQNAMTGPTIFDAYKMDGTLLWRMNMGLNLTSGAHYNQFVIADFDGDGKSEFMIKTADATTVYGVTNGVVDTSKVISVIGNAADNGKYLNSNGHITGGPEYMSVFKGETGQVIDTVDYAFPLGDVASWGDTWYNRSDRFLSGLAYLDGVKPSAVFGRGYYARTTFVAYSLVNGKLTANWTFDSDAAGRGGSLGFHNLSTGDVDNDGFDEIVAGSLTLDHDGTILYAMDGDQGREQGSHGDAQHLGAFDPNREGLEAVEVHEEPAVASLEVHDAATGETLASYYNYVDAGRGLAANIDSKPGYEFWGATGGSTPATGGGIYNVTTATYSYTNYKNAGVSINFALYWDGDLNQELLDDTSISKFDESKGTTSVLKSFSGVMSSNGTKATPSLQADILGDWREEVVLPTTDSSELRIYSTTIPTNYRIFTLMHDPLYRNGIGWQNSAYNQPPHLDFYLGEDIKDKVLAVQLGTPKVQYNKTKAVLTGPEKVHKGEAFEVKYGLDFMNYRTSVTADQTAVYAQDVTFTYDPAVLEFVNAESLQNGVSVLGTQTGSGKVRVLLAAQGASGAVSADDANIVKLRWNVKSGASSDQAAVSVAKAELSNAAGDVTAAAVTDYYVELGADTSTLTDVITAAQALYDQAVEGLGAGQYYPGSKARFLDAVNTAKAVAANLSASAADVEAAKSALLAARKAFVAASGDLSSNGAVNVGDLGMVAAQYGKSNSSTDWSDVSYLDIDRDGSIGLVELVFVAKKILAD